MSARRQKHERADQRVAQDTSKPTERGGLKITANSKKFRQAITSIIGIVVVLAIVVYVVFSSPLFYNSVTAVSIGTHNYTAAEYNYRLVNITGVSPDTKLSTIPYNDTQNADEYFREVTLNMMTEYAMLYDAGKAEGYTVPTEGDNVPMTAAEQVAEFRRQNTAGGVNFDDFLEDAFGKGMTVELLEKLIEENSYAMSYYQNLIDTTRETITDEQREEKYSSVATEYDLTTFYSFKILAEKDIETGEVTEATLAIAKNQADELAATHNGELFADVVLSIVSDEEKDLYTDPDTTLRSNVAPSQLEDKENKDEITYGEWLMQPERIEGDTEIFSDADGYTVVLYISRNQNQYHRATFRDIVFAITPDTEAGETTQTATTEARNSANEVLDEWKAGEATDESFGILAQQNSSDTSSASSGGLVTNAQLGNYAYEIEEWLYDPARQPGDTEVIFIDSNTSPAYHVLYYVEAEEQRYDHLIGQDRILSDFYTEWKNERLGNYALSEKFGFNFRIQ